MTISWLQLRKWILVRASSLDDCYHHPNTTRFDEDDLLDWFQSYGDMWVAQPSGRRGNEVILEQRS